MSEMVKIIEINWGQRARTEYGDIDGMSASLLEHGQITPILLERGSKQLIAGGRRLTAAIQAGWEEIYVVYRDEMTPLQKRELELEENIQRKELTWQEQVFLTKEIDNLKRELYGKDWSVDDTAKSIHKSARVAYNDLNLAKMAEDFPEILQEKEKAVAISKAGRLKAQYRRAIIVQDLPVMDFLHNGDALQILPKLASDSVDLILFDPPYGINYAEAGNLIAGEGLLDTHNIHFNDTPEHALVLLKVMLPECLRVLKEGSHMYIFFSLRLELESRPFVSEIEKYFSLQKAPLFWIKNTHSNKEPYTRFGVSYEPFYFCWKGKSRPKALIKPHHATFHVSTMLNKQHPTEKPLALYKELIELSSIKGETILDPMCGSGNSILAAVELGRTAIGIEQEKAWFDVVVEKIANHKQKGGD